MREIDWNITNETNILVLLTMQELEDGVITSMADFLDLYGLFYPILGKWIGLSRNRGMRFGYSPEMRDGIWYLSEDNNVSDIKLSTSDLILKQLP